MGAQPFASWKYFAKSWFSVERNMWLAESRICEKTIS